MAHFWQNAYHVKFCMKIYTDQFIIFSQLNLIIIWLKYDIKNKQIKYNKISIGGL